MSEGYPGRFSQPMIDVPGFDLRYVNGAQPPSEEPQSGPQIGVALPFTGVPMIDASPQVVFEDELPVPAEPSAELQASIAELERLKRVEAAIVESLGLVTRPDADDK